MNEWHPLPPPQMVPLSFVTGQAFHLGFMAGCEAASVFYMVFLSLVAILFPLCRFALSRLPALRVRPVLPLALCLLLAGSVVRAQTVTSYTFTPPSALNASSWQVLSSSGVVGSNASSGGWSFGPNGSQYTVTFPSGLPSSGVYALHVPFASNGSTYATSFSAGPTPPPVVTGSPCTSSYPASVAPLLGSAPSPCAYFSASQGFNSSSAPLLLAALGVLVVILAIWMGHDTIMSIFRRLMTGMTGGN